MQTVCFASREQSYNIHSFISIYSYNHVIFYNYSLAIYIMYHLFIIINCIILIILFVYSLRFYFAYYSRFILFSYLFSLIMCVLRAVCLHEKEIRGNIYGNSGLCDDV